MYCMTVVNSINSISLFHFTFAISQVYTISIISKSYMVSEPEGLEAISSTQIREERSKTKAIKEA